MVNRNICHEKHHVLTAIPLGFNPLHIFHSTMNIYTLIKMTKWMTCDLTSFSTVFQSYQDNGRMIIKAVCNTAPFRVENISP